MSEVATARQRSLEEALVRAEAERDTLRFKLEDTLRAKDEVL